MSSLGIQAIDWWAKRPAGGSEISEYRSRRMDILEKIFPPTLPSRAAVGPGGGRCVVMEGFSDSSGAVGCGTEP